MDFSLAASSRALAKEKSFAVSSEALVKEGSLGFGVWSLGALAKEDAINLLSEYFDPHRIQAHSGGNTRSASLVGPVQSHVHP